LAALLDSLSAPSQKFIIFIGGLSFSSDDRDFTALKTVLESSVAACASGRCPRAARQYIEYKIAMENESSCAK